MDAARGGFTGIKNAPGTGDVKGLRELVGGNGSKARKIAVRLARTSGSVSSRSVIIKPGFLISGDQGVRTAECYV